MAYVAEPCVRETTETAGTGDLVLLGPMQGCFAFSDFMAPGDICDAVVSYGAVRESFRATLNPDGSLARTAVQRAKHANGAVNQTKVTLPAGLKVVIMTVRPRVVPRVDVPQTFTTDETARHRANVPPFESGTRMLFQQSAAPVGWTKDVSNNDKALRIVSGTVGGGGTVPFSTVHSRTVTDATTLSIGTTPPHDHGGTTGDDTPDHEHDTTLGRGAVQFGSNYTAHIADANNNTPNRSGGANRRHRHSISSQGGGGSHAHAIDLRVQYVDVIIATKD